MVPWLVLLCVLLAPSAAFLLWGWRTSRQDVSLMRATETTPAGEIAKLPPGSLVEIKGRLRCAAPVTGNLSKSPCAHFVASIERDYEILEYDPGCKSSYRVKRTACELANTMSAPFEIEDDSGRATVIPDGALIEGIQAIDRYERHAAEGAAATTGEDVTLARRYREMLLPLDAEIYVLGVVGEDRCIRAPDPGAKDQRFLISVNSEEARSTKLSGMGKWMLGAGLGCLIGAALCLGLALWLVWTGLHQIAPPSEVLQGSSVW
jgi:hypothetical protein